MNYICVIVFIDPMGRRVSPAAQENLDVHLLLLLLPASSTTDATLMVCTFNICIQICQMR